jgi:hypothetical protein
MFRLLLLSFPPSHLLFAVHLFDPYPDASNTEISIKLLNWI